MRTQRDTIVDTAWTLKDIGSDLVLTDRYTKDLTMRKFVQLLVLYALIVLLGMAEVLLLYYKIKR